MELKPLEQQMLDGKHGKATQKAMQILTALGKIYDAQYMLPVTSVQVAGVSYDNLGEAGLAFLDDLVQGGAVARVLTTLNPAGMDIDDWGKLGIPPDFAKNQVRVIEAFEQMGIISTCTCTPYLSGNLPHFGEHIAWAESSAVAYANSVIGARTNREGGPSALASALTGVTPAYGFHLPENRKPSLTFNVRFQVQGTHAFGVLGWMIGKQLETSSTSRVPYLKGIAAATLEELKSFCASIATYGGVALFHMENITPEAQLHAAPTEEMTLQVSDFETALTALNASEHEIDFVTLGCPHLSIREVRAIAQRLEGKKVKKEFWVTIARPVKHIADRMGYTQIIEKSGVIIATDTCCVVAPIKGRFRAMATDSAKACYYAQTKNGFQTRLMSFDEVISEALK